MALECGAVFGSFLVSQMFYGIFQMIFLFVQIGRRSESAYLDWFG